MKYLRSCRLAAVLLAASLLSGCLLKSATPEIASGDLALVPLAGDYASIETETSGVDKRNSDPSGHSRIEIVAPGVYRVIFRNRPNTEGEVLEPGAIEFRLLKAPKSGEYVVLADDKKGTTNYFLMQIEADGGLLINSFAKGGERLDGLKKVARKYGLGMLSDGPTITGNVTGKAIAALFRDLEFVEQFSLTPTIRFRPATAGKLNPSSLLVSRGMAYARKGEHDRALEEYGEALRLDPDNAVAYARRGRTFEAKGDRAKAAADYGKALAAPATTRQGQDEQAHARQRLAVLQPALPPPAPAAKPPSAPPPEAKPASAPPPPVAKSTGRRVALVIGNARYRIEPLQNPANDASAVAEVLERRLKFDKVILKLDLGREGFLGALRELSREAAGASIALAYYAGHATERRGRNYLIPVDAKLDTVGDLGLETIALETVLEQLAGATMLKLVILDSCRNNVFPLAGEDRGGTRGLGRIEPGRNTLVVYAAKEGTVAADGKGRHSPFTEALLKRMATPGLELRFLFGEVRDDVLAATAHQREPQEPYVYGTLGGSKLYLHP